MTPSTRQAILDNLADRWVAHFGDEVPPITAHSLASIFQRDDLWLALFPVLTPAEAADLARMVSLKALERAQARRLVESDSQVPEGWQEPDWSHVGSDVARTS